MEYIYLELTKKEFERLENLIDSAITLPYIYGRYRKNLKKRIKRKKAALQRKAASNTSTNGKSFI